MVEAQISPILGMTLLEQADVWTIVALVVSAIAAGASAGVAVVIWKTQGRQLDHQTKLAERQQELDSARLVVELDAVYRTEKFREIAELMFDRKINLNDKEQKRWFLRYINHTQFVCKLYYNKMITESDMGLMYGGLAALLRRNKRTIEYVEKHKKWLNYLYWYINLESSDPPDLSSPPSS